MDFIMTHAEIIIAVIAILLILLFLASIYKVASIDKVLIITGGKEPVIKISGGSFVIPIFRKADYFDLCMLTVKADKDEIKTCTAVPIVADWTAQIRPCVSDESKLRTAIISFKERGNDGIVADVKLTLMGAVRDVVASMTPEALLKDKEAFKQKVQQSVADEMENMGLELVSLNIQDISDNNGYYDDIAALDSADKRKAAAIKAAEVEQTTREKKAVATQVAEITEANAQKESKIAKMEAELAEQEKRKETDTKLAEFKIATDTAKANADVAGELQKTIRLREVEEQKGAVEVMKAEQENLAAQKQREVLLTRAESDKQKKRVEAEAEADVKAIEADANIKVAERNAEAARKEAQGKADVERTEAETKVKVAEAEASKIREEGLAQADVTKAKAIAEAEGKKADLLADAEGIKAKKLAEAEGEKAIAEARAANDKVNFEIEKLRIQTEAQIKVSTAMAEVMANVGQNAEFVHIGGDGLQNAMGTGKTGNILLDTISQIPVLMKSLNVENQALNGRSMNEEVKELSESLLSGLNKTRNCQSSSETKTTAVEESTDDAEEQLDVEDALAESAKEKSVEEPELSDTETSEDDVAKSAEEDGTLYEAEKGKKSD